MEEKSPPKLIDVAIGVIGVSMVLYHFAYAQILIQGVFQHQATHLMFALVLVFLGTLKKKSNFRLLLFLFLVLSLISTGYVILFTEQLSERAGWPTTIDMVIGWLLVFLVIEATRRTFGLVLPAVAILFIAYSLWGQYVPQPLYHAFIPRGRLISYLNIGLQGMFGTVLNVSANYIFLLTILGGLFEIAGVNLLFRQIGSLASRRLSGGPALTAVVSSAFVGMISGQASTNVAIVGPFSIPLMRKAGYTAEQAGAVEAAASTGGQIMPPVMGSAAFLMAGILGISYAAVMKMGAIPALLYFLTVFMFVQIQAMKLKLRPMPEEISNKELLRRSPVFLIPFSILTILLIKGYSINYTAFWAITFLLIVSFIRKETRPTLDKLVDGLTKGAILGANVAVASACLGPMISVITLTGLGIKIPNLVEMLCGGYLLVALFIVMIVSLILGCGVPTVAVYILTALVTAPVLVRMGVDLVVAHFICFYFACFSMVTPPVALASLVASNLAGSSFTKTSYIAIKACFVGLILPYLFVYCPVLLLRPVGWLPGAMTLIAIVILIICILVFLNTYWLVRLTVLESVVSFVTAIILTGAAVRVNYGLFATGIGLFIILNVWQLKKRREERRAVLKVSMDA